MLGVASSCRELGLIVATIVFRYMAYKGKMQAILSLGNGLILRAGNGELD